MTSHSEEAREVTFAPAVPSPDPERDRLDALIAAGERRRIVAWLRHGRPEGDQNCECEIDEDGSVGFHCATCVAAARIEAGDHHV